MLLTNNDRYNLPSCKGNRRRRSLAGGSTNKATTKVPIEPVSCECRWGKLQEIRDVRTAKTGLQSPVGWGKKVHRKQQKKVWHDDTRSAVSDTKNSFTYRGNQYLPRRTDYYTVESTALLNASIGIVRVVVRVHRIGPLRLSRRSSSRNNGGSCTNNRSAVPLLRQRARLVHTSHGRGHRFLESRGEGSRRE